jgi:hypothetical protein
VFLKKKSPPNLQQKLENLEEIDAISKTFCYNNQIEENN